MIDVRDKQPGEDDKEKKKKKYVSKREWIKQQQEKPVTLEDVRSHAVFLLDRRDYTEKRLRDKLNQRYRRDTQYNDAVISAMKDMRAIDDMRFVEMYVSSLLNQKMGKMKIRQKLMAKGFGSEAIDFGMSLTNEKDYLSDAIALKERKFGNKVFADYKEKQKAMAFLVRKGFDMGTVVKAFDASDCDE